MLSLDQVIAVLLLMRVCRGRRLQHHPLLMFAIGLCMVILLVSACGSPPIPPPAKPGGSAQANVGSSGAYQTDIPITVPAYHGLEPHLRLAYNSQAGAGWLGTGWSLLGFSSVLRASPGRGAPNYDAQDLFYLDGMELIPCRTGMQSPSCLYPSQASLLKSYTTHVESYRRIAWYPIIPGNGDWFVWEKTGTEMIYKPRIGPLQIRGARAWDIATVEDTLGNTVSYDYWQDTTAPDLGEGYPKDITYNGTIIKFYWEPRPDPITYAAGYTQVAARYRLKSIDVTMGGTRARAYALQYAQHSGSLQSVLARVQEYGKDAVLDATGTVLSGTALPAVELAYQQPEGQKAWAGTPATSNAVAPGWDGVSPAHVFSGATQDIDRIGADTFHTGDFDGDGRSDGLLTRLSYSGQQKPVIHFVTQFADGRRLETSADLPDRYVGYDSFAPPQDGRAELVRSWVADVNGDGRDDLILLSWAPVDPAHPSGRLKLQLDTAISAGDGRFGFGSADFQTTSWVTSTIFDFGVGGALGPHCQPGDVNGDGRSDLVCLFTELEGRQFLGTALSVGNGTFNLDPAPVLIADDPGDVPEDWDDPPYPILPFETRSMSLGDINADGLSDVEILDLRPADAQSCDINHLTKCVIHFDLLNAIANGDGTYTLERTQTPWTRQVSDLGETVQAADLDGDGHTDYLVLVASLTAPRNVVLRSIKTAVRSQSGGYTFKDQETPKDLQDRQVNVTLGDANGDGLVDILAVAPLFPGAGSHCSTAITVTHPVLARILSNGDGTFALPTGWDDCRGLEEVAQPWPDVLNSDDLQAADTNGDGLADFLIATTSLINDGKQLSFGAFDSVSHATGLDTRHWQSADITGDGRDDLVYISSQTIMASIHSLLKEPDGIVRQVAQPVPIWENPALRSWKILDVNGDGRADLVHLQCLQPFIFPPCVLNLDTFLSNGDGTFARQPRAYFSSFVVMADVPNWRAMDVNGDGKTDLVYLTYLRGPGTTNEGLYVQTLTSNGDGTWTQLPLKGPFRPPLRPSDPPSGPFAEDTQDWRPMDVNGDGKTDLVRIRSSHSDILERNGRLRFPFSGIQVSTLLATGSGDWGYSSYTYKTPQADQWADLPSFENTLAWHAADVNGDGTADLVHLDRVSTGLRIHTLLSNGNGSWTPQPPKEPTFAPSLAPYELADTLNWQVADTNGDGRTDLLHLLRTNTGIQIVTLRSAGTGEWTVQPETDADPVKIGNRSAPTWRPGDVDGDGKWDLARVDISSSNPPHLHVSQLLSHTPLDVLVSQSSGGGTTQVSYAPSSHYPVSDPAHGCSLPLGAVVQVVASTTISDGRGLTDKASYAYDCARWSYAQRMFLGWTDVTSSAIGVANHPASILVKRYQQTDQCFTQAIDTHYRDPQGHFLAGRDILAYNSPGSAPPYNCQVLYRNHLEYDTGSSMAQNAYTYFAYDAFGNVTDIFEYGLPNQGGDERTTTIAYNPAPGPYLVGLPWQVTVSEGAQPARKADRITYFCYDYDNGTDSSNCPGKPTKGLMTMMQAVDDKGLYVNTTNVYDAYGNLLNDIDARHNGEVIFYDKTFHLYPEVTCNALSQCTSLEWDTVLGQITKSTDPNGKSTQFKYDALGRLILTTYPNGGVEHRDYLDWGNPTQQRVRTWDEDGSADGLWSESYLDGLGRPYRIVRKGDAPGRTFAQETVYSDASSQPYQQSHWYTAPSSTTPVYEVFEYDGANRLIKQTHPDRASLRWSYGSDGSSTWVLSSDELRHERAVYRDAYGRISRVREKNEGKYSYTTYTYDAVDEVLTVTDDQGNVTTNTWDILGHKRTTSDPDRGMWSYTYDLAGNLHTQTDANKVTLAFTYDALDRLETKQYPSGEKVVWHYDEPGHGASRGRLTSVSDPSAASCVDKVSESYSYNELGEVTSKMKCVDQRDYTLTFGYNDPLGRLSSVVYPDGEAVTYTYDAAGRLQSMPGYVKQFQYDAAGNLTLAQYSNRTEEHFTYDPKREWLKTSTVSLGTSQLYQASYKYYSNGLVRSSSSPTNNMNLSYTYDELNRLTDVSGDLQEHFTYDSLGNMKSNSGVGTYTYPVSGPTGCTLDVKRFPCKGPHAVQQAGTQTYTYDDNGNMKTVFDSDVQATKRIYWDEDNRPEWLWDFNNVATRMIYDAWGNRVVRWRGSDTTFYYGPLLEYSFSKGLTKYYYAGSLLVARKDATGIYWYHQDHLGSTRLMTDRRGSVVARYNYASFGRKTYWSGPPTNDIQFTEQRTDEENGLVYMNSRYYDPQLARFISADPIVPDGQNPQALNAYSYVYNNPISNVDPMGLQSEPADTGIEWWNMPPSSIGGLPDAGIQLSGLQPQTQPPPTWGQLPSLTEQHNNLGDTSPPCSMCHTGPFHHLTQEEIITQMAYGAVPFLGIFVALAVPEIVGALGIESASLLTASIRLYQIAPRLFSFLLAVGNAINGTPNGASNAASEEEVISNLAEAEIESAINKMTVGDFYRTPASVSEAGVPLESLVPVSRWGRPGLQPGDWVMNGPPNWRNYFFSFKWDPNPTNIQAPFSVGEGYMVPPESVGWPIGWGINGWWKGLFGQRIYTP